MKEFITYECSICGNKDKDKEVIQRCEESHFNKIKDIKITEIKFSRYSKYPGAITVEFEDGFTITYT